MIADSQTALDAASARASLAESALRAGRVGLVGLELEAHLVDLAGPGNRVSWDRLQTVLRALPTLPGGSRVTVEPGGQVELSGPPLPDVAAAVGALRADRQVLCRHLGRHDLGLAALGTDPLRPPARVHPGHRYAAMEGHFAACGTRAAGLAMMTSTASLQVNLEAGPPELWRDRVRRAHRLGPVLVSVSACSPALSGRRSGWRSTRQHVWGSLDQQRCGPLLGQDEPACEWADYALTAPVMLVRTGDVAAPVLGTVPFAGWLSGEAELGGRRPTAEDLVYHQTTLFPPVRLRGFLEIRYLDAAPEPWWPALAAVTATLMDAAAIAAEVDEALVPVAGAWDRAARAGLADGPLQDAAVRCLELAAAHCPAALREDVQRLAGLVAQGRCPGDGLPADPTEQLLAGCEAGPS